MSGSLASSPASIFQQLLVDLSLGTIPTDEGSWPVYAGNLPGETDNSILVTDSENVAQGVHQISGQTQEHHGVKITVRGQTRPTAWTKANAVAVALDGSVRNTTVTVSSIDYIVYAVDRRSGPLAVGKEPETNRYIYTINVVASLRQTT